LLSLLSFLSERRRDFSARTGGSRTRWKGRLLTLLLEQHLLLNLLLLGDLSVGGDLGCLAVKSNFGLLEVTTGICSCVSSVYGVVCVW
jgi:hypothetical protein